MGLKQTKLASRSISPLANLAHVSQGQAGVRVSDPLRLLAKRPWLPDTAGMKFATPLPIDAVLDEVRTALAARASAVLVAPPGAGKTTRVPLALMDEGWLKGRKIL